MVTLFFFLFSNQLIEKVHFIQNEVTNKHKIQIVSCDLRHVLSPIRFWSANYVIPGPLRIKSLAYNSGKLPLDKKWKLIFLKLLNKHGATKF